MVCFEKWSVQGNENFHKEIKCIRKWKFSFWKADYLGRRVANYNSVFFILCQFLLSPSHIYLFSAQNNIIKIIFYKFWKKDSISFQGLYAFWFMKILDSFIKRNTLFSSPRLADWTNNLGRKEYYSNFRSTKKKTLIILVFFAQQSKRKGILELTSS